MKTFYAYHGTGYLNAKPILEEGFIASEGDEHWLGDGAYFFVEGIPTNPKISAEKWAIAEAWDKERKTFKYTDYVVIESQIKVEEALLLDLRTKDGQRIFAFLRDEFYKKLRGARRKFLKNSILDGKILNIARSEGIIEVDVIEGDFFIKFTEERINNLNSRIPNVSICAVFDPKKNIGVQGNKIVSSGKIKK